MDKRATTAFPIHAIIADRWSPRAFEERPVSRNALGSLLEAARWAPSCYNEQPWAFLLATSDDAPAFERLAGCLLEGNSWATTAPVLMLSVAKLTFERNGKANRHAHHDVGLAVATLVLQAQALGLSVHQMAGFDLEIARDRLAIPSGWEPTAMIALGYRGDDDMLPETLRERELAPRSRKALSSFVFGAAWSSPSPLQPD